MDSETIARLSSSQAGGRQKKTNTEGASTGQSQFLVKFLISVDRTDIKK